MRIPQIKESKLNQTTEHRGYAATGRTGGGLQRKIEAAARKLLETPLSQRDEDWAASSGGVKYAAELLSQGRRAKAGKVLAKAVAS